MRDSKPKTNKNTTAQEQQHSKIRSGLRSKTSGKMKRYSSNCQATKCKGGMRSSRSKSVGRRRKRTGYSLSGNEGSAAHTSQRNAPIDL
ncbi:MAG TPA: hypothetical protein C5S51_11475 [Methanosarcinaceae archaeon]|nr:hypothetical protein [Methanosarcinaceae archaeon]